MSEDPVELTIMILAKNEAENLRVLIPAIRRVADGLGSAYEIMVVDGRSKDDTIDVAKKLSARALVQDEPGYGGAFRTAFREAKGEYILNIDADCSHNPKFIETLWNERAPNRLVIASRYVAQGGATMPFYRRVLSEMLNFVYSRFFSLPYRDLSSGFRLYHASAIRPVVETLTARDFDVLLEVLVKFHENGGDVKEVPFNYEPRQHGSSNVHLVKFAISYIKTLVSSRKWRKPIVRGETKFSKQENIR